MYLRLEFTPTWRTAFAAATLLITLGSAGSTWAQEQGQVFVANYYGDSVTGWSLGASGNTTPVFTILEPSGASPHQFAINHRGSELIVANNVAYTVAIYDRVSGTLKRTIGGDVTGIVRPTGVAIDETRGEIYVANDWGLSITVYDALANGNVLPKRTITSHGRIASLAGLAIDLGHDEILVSDYWNNTIFIFERSANGDSAPKRQISGAGLSFPQGVALDVRNDKIIVANSSFVTPNAGSILTFNRTDRTDDGSLVAPVRKLEGAATGLCNPFSVAIDYLNDNIVVANANFGHGTCPDAVTTYSRTADGNIAPSRKIAGALTTLNYPTSAVIYYGGALNLGIKPSAATITAGGIITYNITATANGGTILDAKLLDTLPTTAGLSWNLDLAGDAAACTLVDHYRLNCDFGRLTKGQTKSIKILATTQAGRCLAVSNQVMATYNDGTAALTAASPVATVNVKCK